MKTTIDISDHLLNRAKELARKKKTTLKELTEEGLALVLSEHSSRTPRAVEPVVFDGQGLSKEFRGKSWAEIRDEIYKGFGA
jgi:ornithine carbamoyltransferase